MGLASSPLLQLKLDNISYNDGTRHSMSTVKSFKEEFRPPKTGSFTKKLAYAPHLFSMVNTLLEIGALFHMVSVNNPDTIFLSEPKIKFSTFHSFKLSNFGFDTHFSTLLSNGNIHILCLAKSSSNIIIAVLDSSYLHFTIKRCKHLLECNICEWKERTRDRELNGVNALLL